MSLCGGIQGILSSLAVNFKPYQCYRFIDSVVNKMYNGFSSSNPLLFPSVLSGTSVGQVQDCRSARQLKIFSCKYYIINIQKNQFTYQNGGIYVASISFRYACMITSLHPVRSQDLAYMNHNMVNALKWISRIASSRRLLSRHCMLT